MWGAVVGDIAGSRFEGSRGGPKDFELFHRLCMYTDDTVCTAAIAYIIVNDRKPDATRALDALYERENSDEARASRIGQGS